MLTHIEQEANHLAELAKSLPANNCKTDDFDVARIRLGNFIVAKANEICRVNNISYEESMFAPESFEGIIKGFAEAFMNRKPFYVSSVGCDETVYIAPYINWAFRFWHDYLHFKHNLTLSFIDELMVSNIHVHEVELEFGVNSLEAKIMQIDTAAQAMYYQIHKDFVVDQLAFCKAMIQKY